MSNGDLPTAEIFDDLADLYLSNGGAASLSERPPHAPSVDQRDDDRSTPTSLSKALAEAGIAPAPRTLGGRSAGRARIDALVVGHLPVASPPWISQAAATLAGRYGATALIRSMGVESRVELFPVGVDDTDLDTLLAASGPTTLREARHLAEAWFPNWIIQLPDPERIHELRLMRPSRVVLLTGADQAAVVSAYQTLKRLGTEKSDDLEFAIVIAGAPLELAQEAFQRLRNAGRDFLHRTIELLAIIPQIEPARSRTLARFRHDGDVIRWLNESDGACAIAPHIPTGKTIDPDREDRIPPGPKREERRPIVNTEDQISRRQDAASVSFDVPSCESSPSSSAPAPRQAAVSSEIDVPLVTFVDRLEPVEVRCPRAPGAEFALDEDRRLHILAWDDAGEDRLEDMLVAAEWAIEHSAILSKIAGPMAALHNIGEVTLHFFTNDPRSHSRLLKGPWRVHLLLDRTRTSGRWMHLELS